MPAPWGDQASLDRFEALFAKPDLLVVELSASVVELATQLRANDRWPEAVMITGDAGFQRVRTLQVCLIAGA